LKKAFTLIEIIISVAIIFMIMSVVLEVTSNTKHIFRLNKNNNKFIYKSSVGVIEKGKNVYEMLKDFNIKNDKIIKTLKKEKLNIKEDIEYSLNNIVNDQDIRIIMKKIAIYNDFYQISYFSPEVK